MYVVILKNEFLAWIFMVQKDYNRTWYVSKSKYDYLLVRDRFLEFYLSIVL